MSEINFLERSFNANNNPKGVGGPWLSPNGLAYDAVGNEVAVGDLVKLTRRGTPRICKVLKTEEDPDDCANMSLERWGWECSYKILKVSSPE